MVCRELGFSGGTAFRNANYGEGSGQIWLDNVECVGTESTLTACSSNELGDVNCLHREDAGVSCGNIAYVHYWNVHILLCDVYHANFQLLIYAHVIISLMWWFDTTYNVIFIFSLNN